MEPTSCRLCSLREFSIPKSSITSAKVGKLPLLCAQQSPMMAVRKSMPKVSKTILIGPFEAAGSQKSHT